MCWRKPPVPWKEQNLDRQIAAFVAMGAEEREIITDKESGKSLDRPGYQALKNVILRKGDTLVVKSLDRLSRNKTDIRNELQFFKDQGIRLKVIDLPTTMMDLPEGQSWVFEMVNNILIEVMGMPELRFHDLRHTFSINSLQAGDDIKTVQENLGHATASFTLATYAHATLGMKRESANRMDAFTRSVQEGGENHVPAAAP